MMHVIELSVSHRTQNRTIYLATHNGEKLVVSGDPEYDACRVLLERGITGTLTTRWHGSPHASATLDIEAGANLRTDEGRKRTPRTAKWYPFAQEEA